MASSLNLAIVELRMLGLSPSHASATFANPSVAAAASKGPLVAFKLSGQDAVAKWSAAIAGQAGVSGSISGAAAAKEAEALFGGAIPPTASKSEFGSSSLLLIRPHAVRDGKLGAILHQLMASGFAVRGMHMLQLSRPNAVEFLEVYKGVVPEFADWVEELAGGKCVAVQAVYSAQADMSVPALRELCGAHDPEIASHLHKGSLRALYGDDKVKNAVHCTDLPDDAPLELDYFFCLLPSAA
jgi:nucleoside-diphosphate kinase